jgi:ArsR family transcriptional regulator, arsenate/arsenite/antimonite-responsive transcriptional repressor
MKSEDVILSLFTLAQETRLAVFRLLVKRGPQGYTPGELAGKLSIPAPTLSFHLKELAGGKLVTARREGRFLFYSANFARVQQVIGFLTDQCCVLSDRDCSAACAPPGVQVNVSKKRA